MNHSSIGVAELQRELAAIEGRFVGGKGKEAEIEYFRGYVKPANQKEYRRDRRLSRKQNGIRKESIIRRHTASMALALTWLRNTSPGSDALRSASIITSRGRMSPATRKRVPGGKITAASLTAISEPRSGAGAEARQTSIFFCVGQCLCAGEGPGEPRPKNAPAKHA